MKQVRINAGNVGLVFKSKDYKRTISQGKHWLGFNERVINYDMLLPFNAPIALDILLQDETLLEKLHVIEVKDSELVLVF